MDVVSGAGSGAEDDQRAEGLEAVAGETAGIAAAAHSHCEPGAEHQASDRAGWCEHEQRQYARRNGIGAITEADQFEQQQRGDKADDRADEAAGNLQRIFHLFLDRGLNAAGCKAGCGTPHWTGQAGNSFIAFERLR